MAPAAVHMVEAGGYLPRFLHIMLHRQHGERLFPVQPGEFSVNFPLTLYIHAGGGLIQNEQVRTSHEGPGNEYLLVLPAGQITHKFMGIILHARDGQGIPYGNGFQTEQLPVGVNHLFHCNGKGVVPGGHLGHIAQAAGL